ncbi:MAG: DUF6879 family protein, partial [Pseudonocardiaceae bacterium]
MNFDEFDAVFDRFHATAFRLETLPRYADDEDAEFTLFLAGEPLPERSSRPRSTTARAHGTLWCLGSTTHGRPMVGGSRCGADSDEDSFRVRQAET